MFFVARCYILDSSWAFYPVIYSKEHNSHITTQFPYNHSKSCFQPISHTVITTEAQWSWMISRTSLKSHKKHSWISDDVDSSHSPRTCTCRVLHITPGYKGAAASIKKKKKVSAHSYRHPQHKTQWARNELSIPSSRSRGVQADRRPEDMECHLQGIPTDPNSHSGATWRMTTAVIIADVQ